MKQTIILAMTAVLVFSLLPSQILAQNKSNLIQPRWATSSPDETLRFNMTVKWGNVEGGPTTPEATKYNGSISATLNSTQTDIRLINTIRFEHHTNRRDRVTSKANPVSWQSVIYRQWDGVRVAVSANASDTIAVNLSSQAQQITILKTARELYDLNQPLVVAVPGTSHELVITVPHGNLTMSQDQGTPPTGILLADSRENITSKIKFSATKEDWTINKLRIKLNTAANESDVSQIRIVYPGGEAIGVLSTSGGESYVNFIGLNWLIEKNTSETLTIYANLGPIDPNTDATGHEIKLGVDYNDGFEAISHSSMRVLTSIGSADVFGNAMYLRKTKPTVNVTQYNGTLINGELDIFKFNITADAKGDVPLKKFTFAININDYTTTTPFVLTNWKIYDGTTALAAEWSNGSTTAASTIETGADLPLTNGNGVLMVEPNSETTVTADTTKTFTLKATISNAAIYDSLAVNLKSSNDSAILTGGLADHATELVKLDDGAITSTVDFLWSDKAKGVYHTDTYQNIYKDWTNGYLLEIPASSWTWTWPS
jgi:hypothetical protein